MASSTYYIDSYAKSTNSILTFKNTQNGKSVSFEAFLTDFSQTFSSTWNTDEVYGRNDPIATFQGTKRTLTLGWDLPAGNPTVAANNLLNCSVLTQFMYPSYVDSFNVEEKDKKIISKAPLVKILYANLIRSRTTPDGLLGWIESLSWTPQMDMGVFTTGKDIYPKVISLSLTFNVLHQHNLGHLNGSFAADGFPF